MIKGTHIAFYPDDVETAKLLLEELLNRSDNVDIGLMGINYRYHLKGTDIDPMSLLQAGVNAAFGCRILGDAMARSSTLWEGIGRYHSSTSWRTRRYAADVLRTVLKGLQDGH